MGTIHEILISSTGEPVSTADTDFSSTSPQVTVKLIDGDIYRFHGEPGASLEAGVVAATGVLNVYLNSGRQQPLVRAFGSAAWSTFEPVTKSTALTGRFTQVS